MTYQLTEWREEMVDRKLTLSLIEKLRGTHEKYHHLTSYYREPHSYNAVGMALRVGGIGVLNDLEARLKWNKLAPCLDLNFEEEGEEQMVMKLYGWYHCVEIKEVDYGLNYLDNRLGLTFRQIADIIEGCLNKKGTVNV